MIPEWMQKIEIGTLRLLYRQYRQKEGFCPEGNL